MNTVNDGPADPARPRIGSRVRALVDDGFVARGLTGRILNRLPTAASVRVLWDNDTASIVRLAGLQLLDDDPSAAAAAGIGRVWRPDDPGTRTA